MAAVHPAHARAGCPSAEAKLYRALSMLPDPWTVLHGVRWLAPSGKDGEADFVLLHPRRGMVVLEVKGGRIDLERGDFYSTDRENVRRPIRDPVEQVVDSKYNLIRLLRARIDGYLPAGHGVVFPDVVLPHGGFGPALPPEVVGDRSVLSDPQGFINRLCTFHGLRGPLSPASLASIVDYLKPTARVRPLLSTTVDETTQALLNLTDEQVELFFELRGVRRLLTTGRAGTGKTVIACELARKLTVEGFRTLYVCATSNLAKHVEKSLADDGVAVSTYHGLADRLETGTAPVTWGTSGPQVWLLHERLVRIADGPPHFDAVIVDEGQDFDPEWLTVLQMLMADPDNGPFYVFADPLQATARHWKFSVDIPHRQLRTNCRNTATIARVASELVADDVQVLGAEGLDPVCIALEASISPATEPAEIVAALTKPLGDLLRRLVKDELIPAERIVVLVDRSPVADALRLARVRGSKLSWVGAESGTPVESVLRFKGLEADVVILVLTRPWSTATTRLSTVYTGMTRARAHLIAIAPEDVLAAMKLTRVDPPAPPP